MFPVELVHKSILIISPEPWDHIFVSKHHYAIHLGRRGNQVFFLGPPSREMNVLKTQFDNVFFVKYTGFPKGLRFYPQFLQRRIISQVYKRLEGMCSNRFDVVWSFDNSVFFDFTALPSHAIKISHIVDLNQNFETRKAAETADYCFCTSTLIQNRLMNYNANVFKITHGYNETLKEREFLPADFTGQTKVVYAGNLEMPYIDWVLLYTIVNENKEVDFYFIGPYKKRQDQSILSKERIGVINSANCHFIGRVESHLLHAYYENADILLIAYQEKYHNDQANPHKMMEYLGSGKMVIGTFTAEYVDLSSKELIMMSKMNADFPSIFRRVLNELSHWNSEILRDERKAIARENSYDKQIDRVQQVIN